MPSLLSAGARCILRRLPALSLPSQPLSDHIRTRRRHAACSASPAVPTPLCQRPAAHVDSVQNVLAWQRSVLHTIERTGSSIEQTADGPSVEELKREVNWALDDAIEGFRQADDEAWQAQTWQQLESELRVAVRRGVDASGWQVQLRASVHELECLWQQRLQDRVPFQYLINTAHWRTYILSVGPGILVPRPETEQLVDMAVAALAARPQLADAPWADLGTGSGAIAIGLADALKQHEQAARVWAVDSSPVAIAYATHNAKACGVHSVVSTALGSWYEPLQQLGLQGKLGGIVSNPPYIPRAEMDTLQAEVGRHEPWGALDGGPGPGLDSLDPICRGAADMLMPGGFLALETAGGQQAHQVAALLQTISPGSYHQVTVHKDCYGVERFVTAARS